MNYATKLQKIGQIVGMHYTTGVSSKTLIIYGIGAPIPPDNGTLPDASVLTAFGVDIFVPDYIGYGRSDGRFTPLNCINTFLELYTAFKDGCTAKNAYEKTTVTLQYDRIICIGRSLGGTYVPLLPRFNPEIQELAIVCPVVDSKTCGSIKGEEANEDFLRSMQEDGYHYLYRGITDPIWKSHLENEDDLSPMDNIEHLQNATLFIGHGEKDTCVNFSKSQLYFEKIQKAFPDKKKQFRLQLYPDGSHGPSTTQPALKDFLEWLGFTQR